MRLELESFPVRSIAFGDTTRWADGRLTVDSRRRPHWPRSGATHALRR